MLAAARMPSRFPGPERWLTRLISLLRVRCSLILSGDLGNRSTGKEQRRIDRLALLPDLKVQHRHTLGVHAKFRNFLPAITRRPSDTSMTLL